MSIRFNADEILQMAQEIERNGSRFYRRAAQIAAHREAQNLLRKLAAMEDDHLELFSEMRAGLSEEERKPVSYDPYDEAALYLKAMADRKVFDVTSDPTAKLTGREDMEELLLMGLQAEKDSIVFYLGLKDLVPERLGRGRVDNIIKEEMGHIATLSDMLSEYQP